MQKKNKLILLGIALMVISIFIINIWQKNTRKEQAFEECKSKAVSLCSEYGISNVAVNISYSQKYEEYDIYLLRVNGTFSDVSMANIYQLVKSVNSLMIDYHDTLLLTEVVLNDKIYELDILNKNELICNDNTVYTYVSGSDKQAMENLKDKLPYVGMREEFLEYTSLEKADSVEKCRDFYSLQTRARYTTYEWNATDEHGWNKITVRYRMHKSHQHDDYVDLPSDNGYVSSMTYTDENGRMQTENYVDTY